MLLSVLSICSDEELDQESTGPVILSEEDAEKAKRREMMRNKIRAVGKMSRALNMLRQERESIVQLKGLMGTDQLPAGTLLGGKNLQEGTRAAAAAAPPPAPDRAARPPPVISTFEKAKQLDKANEAMPPRKENLEVTNTKARARSRRVAAAADAAHSRGPSFRL
jgi:serine/threonine-protein phosphatase 2B catalytic subunit